MLVDDSELMDEEIEDNLDSNLYPTYTPPQYEQPLTQQYYTQKQSSMAQNTIYCTFCSVQLSYPAGSMYIQCPKCLNTMNPQAPQQTQCIGCGTQLAHPPNALYIQCPKCLVTMNCREPPKNPHELRTYQTQTNQKRRKRDPNIPKPNSNAYMIFCKEQLPRVKVDYAHLTFSQQAAKLGQSWRDLLPEQRRPYEEKATLDRERYRREVDLYNMGQWTLRASQALQQQFSQYGPNQTATPQYQGMYQMKPGAAMAGASRPPYTVAPAARPVTTAAHMGTQQAGASHSAASAQAAKKTPPAVAGAAAPAPVQQPSGQPQQQQGASTVSTNGSALVPKRPTVADGVQPGSGPMEIST